MSTPVKDVRAAIKSAKFPNGLGVRPVTLKGVLNAYAGRANNTTGEVWTSAEKIADETNMSPRSVKTARALLTDLGWLVPVGNVQRAVKYQIAIGATDFKARVIALSGQGILSPEDAFEVLVRANGSDVHSKPWRKFLEAEIEDLAVKLFPPPVEDEPPLAAVVAVPAPTPEPAPANTFVGPGGVVFEDNPPDW